MLFTGQLKIPSTDLAQYASSVNLRFFSILKFEKQIDQRTKTNCFCVMCWLALTSYDYCCAYILIHSLNIANIWGHQLWPFNAQSDLLARSGNPLGSVCRNDHLADSRLMSSDWGPGWILTLFCLRFGLMPSECGSISTRLIFIFWGYSFVALLFKLLVGFLAYLGPQTSRCKSNLYRHSDKQNKSHEAILVYWFTFGNFIFKHLIFEGQWLNKVPTTLYTLFTMHKQYLNLR